ncbi:hypothetical protein [Cellulosimicrobium cellulans]|uniref:hypothetical protein n=1 Tax=Cellulosimicrobium cellulans TaxID=1710 RepID=UPI0020CC4183|nr:hypothetical protein NMQ07_19175 [Cellulosimicrobium cellulans]
MTNDAGRNYPRWATPNRPGKTAPANRPSPHRPPAEHADRPTGRPRLARWPGGEWAAVASTVARAVVVVVELVIKHD